MAKLYPPNIEGTIPAFYKDGASWNIEVPFSMNRAVSFSEIRRMALKIRKVNNSELIAEVFTETNSGENSHFTENAAYFTIQQSDFKDSSFTGFVSGMYYKIQMAYVNLNDEVGYYSTIGVIKCTTKPDVFIANLSDGENNAHQYSYIGVYSQQSTKSESRDASEKMYLYRFILEDSDGNVVKDSDWKQHDNTTDTSTYESSEKFEVLQDLDESKKYFLTFKVETTNGLRVNSRRYRINQGKTIDTLLKAKFIAENDFENGGIRLKIKSDDLTSVITGDFLISRANEHTGWSWEKIAFFSLSSENPTKELMIDYTVEQGETYIYCIQQYNSYGIYSNRLLSNKVFSDFEDSFLYDGEKQLKIKFNPKVTSFKNTILESKVDTIGSKYPFISRNGHVNYKDFPISGLISYYSDNDELFMSKDELIEVNTTNLVGENLSAERRFKLKVLDWLSNGKVKLFRSPGEGNYIVYLMNVSLTPNDTLGRMLHTFNANAYEIASFDYDSLTQYNFLNLKESSKSIIKWASIDLSTVDTTEYGEDKGYTGRIIARGNIASIRVEGMLPGSYIYINNSSYIIGATGAFMYETDLNNPIKTIMLPFESKYQGILTYGYYSTIETYFSIVKQIKNIDVPCRQFFGNKYKEKDITKLLNDQKRNLIGIFYYSLDSREVHNIYWKGGEGQDKPSLNSYFVSISNYKKSDAEQIILTSLDKMPLYKIYRCRDDYTYETIKGEEYYIDAEKNKYSPFSGYYYDPISNKIIEESSTLFSAFINGAELNVKDSLERIFYNNPKSLEINNGVLLTIGYRYSETSYSIDEKQLKFELDNYNDAVNDFVALRNKTDYAEEAYWDALDSLESKYNIYLEELSKELQNFEEK